MGYFANYGKNRIHKGKDWLLAFIGPKRSGKSWGALRLACDIDPTFKDNFESRIVFSPGAFIRLLNSGKITKGSAIIVDEAGVVNSAREYWTSANRIILEVLQTFGYLNLVVIFTVPYINFIDPDSRKLINAQFEFTEEENKGVDNPHHPHYGQRCALPHKLKVIRSGKMAGKTFYIMFRDKDGIPIRRAWFSAPDKTITDKYEVLAEVRKDQVIIDAEEAFDKMDSDKKSDLPPSVILNQILRLPKEEQNTYFTQPKNRQKTPAIRLQTLMAHFNVGERTARKVRTLLRETVKKDAKPPI